MMHAAMRAAMHVTTRHMSDAARALCVPVYFMPRRCAPDMLLMRVITRLPRGCRHADNSRFTPPDAGCRRCLRR